jgi:formate-dependent nitrite reductase cytochrome c552 subunit
VDIAINDAWENSAHGGFIGTGPITSDTADAWVHYNWDDTSTRGACQRCHTATGVSNFLNNPAAYDATGNGNNFSHLSGWSAAGGSPQNEFLYCWGCHSDVSTGTLRNPGAITETYAAPSSTSTGTSGTPVTVSYPDINQSNVCMACHLGREVGANITNTIDANGVLGFINSHYLTAGSTLFNKSGYEYAGQVYSGFGYHKNVGAGAAGPCVTCHMTSAEPHKFEVVEKDAADNITAVASTQCGNCHNAMTPATLEAKKAEFNSALGELDLALQARGIYFFSAYPYFFTAPNGGGSGFTDWNSVAEALGVGLSTDVSGQGWKNVMGAAFNYNLLKHDPGSYAHNHDYALKLIADSIDFLSNGLVDGDTSIAAELLGRGINISNSPGYAPIHNDVIASASSAVCSSCHTGAPHYAALGKAQYVAEDITCTNCHTAQSSAGVAANPQVLADYAGAGHSDVMGTYSHEEAGSCSRCHTTSGFVADLAVPGTEYNYPNPEGSNRLQVLACSGCHADLTTGARRAAPAFTATWDRNSIVAVVNFPDVGDSNLCVRCHSARRAGPNITDTATTTAHYLPVAATVFGGTPDLVTITASVPGGPAVGTKYTGVGYEFAGQSYAGLNTHSFVGFGSGGPCVACHMSGTAGHTWKPVTKDAAGNYTSVISTACVSCHSDMDAAHLNASKATFTTRLNALDSALQGKGFYFNRADGRFYQDAAYTTGVDAAYYAARAAANVPPLDVSDLEGAVFNFWLFAYEGGDPCGFIHNRPYAEKLVVDSLDLLNDGIINGN